MDAVLSAALSADNGVRRRAEATLSYLRTKRGFSIALAKRLGHRDASGDDRGGQISSLAGLLLQHFVTDLWEVADHAVLPREDKSQVSREQKQQHHHPRQRAESVGYFPTSLAAGGGREYSELFWGRSPHLPM